MSHDDKKTVQDGSRDGNGSHVQHFLKTDYTEYSVQPNIRFEPNIRPNNRFSRIFVKTDYSAEYSDKTEYSVEPNIRFQKI
jgi:hypothetical protein